MTSFLRWSIVTAVLTAPVAGCAAENEGLEALDPKDPDAADLRTIATLEKSMSLYQTFLDKAGNDPRYLEAVERTKLRVDDIRATIAFLRQGIEERRRKPGFP